MVHAASLRLLVAGALVERKRKETLEMTHTPGPWTVEDPMEGEWWIVQANLPSYEWRTIASIPQGDIQEGFPQETVKANSSLISAAPELLEACHDVKNFLANLENGTRRDDPLHALRLMVHKPLHAALDAAIAKAEGRPADAPAAP